MRDFGFNNMNDDEFRKEFLRILNMYQKGMDNYFKSIFGDNKPTDRYMGWEDFFSKGFDDMDVERGFDEDGSGWETRNWTSPDGNISYTSFSRMFGNENELPNFRERKRNTRKVDVMEMLEEQLEEAVRQEKYEKCAEIRDLISSLKSDKEKEDK